MPVPIEFLRGILGILCVFFAHMLGRSAAAVHGGRQKKTRLYAWTIRTAVCGAALLFRHPVDAVAIGVYAVAAVVLALGYWAEQRPKEEEDLTHEIFPEKESRD
jgi:hypothetical protein